MAESLFITVNIYTNIRQKSNKIWVSYYLQQSLLISGLHKLLTSLFPKVSIAIISYLEFTML